MKKSLYAVIAAALILLVFPKAKAGDRMLSYNDLFLINGDGRNFFVVDYDGNVFFPALGDEAQQGTAIGLDLETQYPVIWDGRIYVYQKEEQTLHCVWPAAEHESIAVELPQGLTRNSDQWSLEALHMTEKALHFVYFDLYSQEKALCRYDFTTQLLQWKVYDDLLCFVLDLDGNAFIVTYDGRETCMYAHDWQTDTHEERMRLQGKFSAFAYDDDGFYAVDMDNSKFVRIENGNVVKSIYSPYAASALGSAVIDHTYWVLGSYGLFAPDYDAEHIDSQVLRIEGSGPNPIDQAFLTKHPNVKIEYVSSDRYESIGKYAAIATGLIELDVCTINNYSAAKSLLDKGYFMDLSAFPELREMAERMYPPIQAFIFEDGQLMMLPYYVRIDDLWECKEENLISAGLSYKDIPATMDELLDMIISWKALYGESEDNESIVPILFDESPASELLYMVFYAYIDSHVQNDISLDFDTERFRTLLQKVGEAADASSVQGWNYNPPKLFLKADEEIPSVYSVTFPLDRDASSRYIGSIGSWVICADSRVPELAAEYIEYRMGLLPDSGRLLLYQDTYEPAERATYAEMRNTWEDMMMALSIEKQMTDDQLEQQDIQNQIDEIEANLNHTPDAIRYLFTAEEIEFYQKTIIPNIAFYYANEIVESSVEGSGARALIEQYLDGILTEDSFIDKLNRRLRMMEMEDGTL